MTAISEDAKRDYVVRIQGAASSLSDKFTLIKNILEVCIIEYGSTLYVGMA